MAVDLVLACDFDGCWYGLADVVKLSLGHVSSDMKMPSSLRRGRPFSNRTALGRKRTAALKTRTSVMSRVHSRVLSVSPVQLIWKSGLTLANDPLTLRLLTDPSSRATPLTAPSETERVVPFSVPRNCWLLTSPLVPAVPSTCTDRASISMLASKPSGIRMRFRSGLRPGLLARTALLSVVCV